VRQTFQGTAGVSWRFCHLQKTYGKEKRQRKKRMTDLLVDPANKKTDGGFTCRSDKQTHRTGDLLFDPTNKKTDGGFTC
jgi:hypothetical protein